MHELLRSVTTGMPADDETPAAAQPGASFAAPRDRERSEERLRLSMEATRQGWFELDLQTGIVESSEQFARLIGAQDAASSAPMTRDAWIGAIHRDDRDAVLERFDRCLRSGETEQMEYRLKGLDGAFRWIRSTAKVVQYDNKGRPERLSGMHADITQQMATTLLWRPASVGTVRSWRCRQSV